VIDPSYETCDFIFYKKEKEAPMLDELTLYSLNTPEYSERGFKLPLPAVVEGKSKSGKDFKEKTVLSYISHQGSSFRLTNSVSLGSDLKLIIDLPNSLTTEKNLKLIINGKVASLEAIKGKNPKKRVSLRFEDKYIIKTDD